MHFAQKNEIYISQHKRQTFLSALITQKKKRQGKKQATIKNQKTKNKTIKEIFYTTVTAWIGDI